MQVANAHLAGHPNERDVAKIAITSKTRLRPNDLQDLQALRCGKGVDVDVRFKDEEYRRSERKERRFRGDGEGMTFVKGLQKEEKTLKRALSRVVDPLRTE